MLEVVGKRAIFVFGVVAHLMLPSIAVIALYGPAIVIGIAADAAYLSIVFRAVVQERSGGGGAIDAKAVGLERMRGVIVTE